MGPGFFVIAILGCADGSGACTPVATLPTRYESRAQCAASTVDVLGSNNDFDYPTLMAECRPSKVRASERLDRVPAISVPAQRG